MNKRRCFNFIEMIEITNSWINHNLIIGDNIKLNKKMVIIFSVFLMLAVFMSSVSAADGNATLGIDEVVDQNTDEILTVEESSAGEDSGLKELENDNILKASNDNNALSANVTVEGKTFDDIQNAIDNANEGDVIILDGLYTESGKVLSINKKLTIIGINNAILDGQNKAHRIASISGNNVVLKNITFMNAHLESGRGAAITVAGENCTIINSTFKNNSAVVGGAIDWNSANGNVINSTFENNFVSGKNSFGGAIRWNGLNGQIINSTFINNTAYSGGAIYWISANGNVINSTFKSNTARSNGGAIYWISANGNVINSTFKSNTASTNGGAIQWTGANGNVINSTFLNNIARARWGGAIYAKSENCTVVNSSFRNNIAYTNGGAIYWNGSNYRVDNSIFINNTVNTGPGGGLEFNTGDNIKIQNSIFINNTSTSQGGAIIGFVSKNVTFENNIFINNTATYGGAIEIHDSINVTMINDIFVNNSARSGGAIYILNIPTTNIIDCSFVNNSASTTAGAIRLRTNEAAISGSNFTNNRAGSGGAIYWQGNNGTLSTSLFTNNSAVNGSAISWFGLNGSVSDSNFTDNQAGSSNLNVTDNGFNLIIILQGNNNYFNAIDSDNEINITNVNGGDDHSYSDHEMGINITVEVYDLNGNLVDNVTILTNDIGQAIYDYSKLNNEQYTYKAYHTEDSYYTYIETSGNVIGTKKYNIIVLNNQTTYYGETTIKINATIQDNETKNTINPNNIKLIFILRN